MITRCITRPMSVPMLHGTAKETAPAGLIDRSALQHLLRRSRESAAPSRGALLHRACQRAVFAVGSDMFGTVAEVFVICLMLGSCGDRVRDQAAPRRAGRAAPSGSCFYVSSWRAAAQAVQWTGRRRPQRDRWVSSSMLSPSPRPSYGGSVMGGRCGYLSRVGACEAS